MRDVVDIACSYGRAVALRRSGSLHGWGTTYENGQSAIPVGLDDVVAVAGGRIHTMALRADGTVSVWGLVDPVTQTIPAPPAGLTEVVAITAADNNCLALRADGTVALWGLTAQTFQPPTDLANVAAIALGRDHGLALRRDGSIVAWGDNTFGQTAVPANAVPARAIAAGIGVSFAIRNDGALVSWGTGHEARVDLMPSDLGPVRQIAVARTHATALLPGPAARAWATPALAWSLASNRNAECAWSIAAGATSTFLIRDRSLFAAPVLHAAPVDVTCVPGGQALFAATISGTPTPWISWSYLDPEHEYWGWQSVPADGHHNDDGAGTLTITEVPAEFDGRRYRCWASNNIGNEILTGEVRLTVATASAGWPAFLTQHFTPAERTDPTVGGPQADPDFDGLCNLLEYAFSRDPRSAEHSTPLDFTGGVAAPSFSFEQPHAVADLTYALESSVDLRNWTEVPFTEYTRSATAVSPTVDRIVLELAVPPPTARQFYRLQVARP
ncbi:MAG: hypothetical protein IPL39_05285 [Opitutaceae bacterium]|nr:hypothetical protein [Opitutaceae bacterium]